MDQDSERNYHEPVMTKEIVELFKAIDGGYLVDATYGGGGHSMALASAYPEIEIIGIDRDEAAVVRSVPERVQVHLRPFSEMAALIEELSIESVSGVLFDLGVSSYQLDTPHRGFSYREAGPLDMRMGEESSTSAAEIVNEWSFEQLSEILKVYGEERFARRIAKAIIAARPIDDTVELAEITRNAIPAATRRTGGHPARRTFQAIRIAANDELAEIEAGLAATLELLKPGGRSVVISYHSLEDRIVKRTFNQWAQGCICPPEFPECRCYQVPSVKVITRKPLRPSEEEVAANPRSRSARIRAVEKVAA